MFIPRHPVVEDQFCSYSDIDGGSAGVGGVVAYAGTVVRLDTAAVNQEAMVVKLSHGNTCSPFGFLMQKVKTGYHQVHPAGYYMPGDLGSSDVIAQAKYNATGTIVGTKAAPVGVAHLGIWDTVHYTCHKSMVGIVSTVLTPMTPGLQLVVADDQGKVTTPDAADSTGVTADDAEVGAKIGGISSISVAMVIKGASAAKCAANIDNTTLYPIRIKLLV